MAENTPKDKDKKTKMTFEEFRSIYHVTSDEKLSQLGAPDDSLIETPELTNKRLKAEASDLDWYYELKGDLQYDQEEDAYFNSEEFDPNLLPPKKKVQK